MDRLDIEKTKSSPFVRLDPETGVLDIGGESYPENSHEFFEPIIDWVDQFIIESDTPITLRVTLAYMNTSSTKYMIDILDKLEEVHEQGREVSVQWYCDAANDRAMDTVEELKEDFTMPFEVIPDEL
jgi:hypothetical protein